MYLTLLILSYPIIASNNRGEGETNLSTLQKVRTREGEFTIESGYSIKWASRYRMQQDGSPDPLWRNVVGPTKDNPAGFLYGPDSNPVMAKAMPKDAADYDDTLLFGYMSAEKNTDTYASKKAGNVEVSPAISTTPYDGDTSFILGVKAANSERCPTSAERHFTRYQYTVTANIGELKARPPCFARFLNTLRGLRVGGSHGSNASELIPEIIAWRWHREPGQGGLYLGFNGAQAPDGKIDLSPLNNRIKNLGLTDVTVAGTGTSLSVDEGFNAIINESKKHLGA
jgi:CRISPR-associated autoregulator DevR family